MSKLIPMFQIMLINNIIELENHHSKCMWLMCCTSCGNVLSASRLIWEIANFTIIVFWHCILHFTWNVWYTYRTQFWRACWCGSAYPNLVSCGKCDVCVKIRVNLVAQKLQLSVSVQMDQNIRNQEIFIFNTTKTVGQVNSTCLQKNHTPYFRYQSNMSR